MYKCGAFNPVTGDTVMQPHGTKLSVKRKSDDELTDSYSDVVSLTAC